jgi:hypothetical protein
MGRDSEAAAEATMARMIDQDDMRGRTMNPLVRRVMEGRLTDSRLTREMERRHPDDTGRRSVG